MAAGSIIFAATPWPWLAALAAALILGFFVWRSVKKSALHLSPVDAAREWTARQGELATEFLTAAAATGKPRGLRWKAVTLGDDILFAIDRKSRELYALAPATISFEAVEGGDMEEVEAVSNLRAATAVFAHRGGRWTTDGRVVFNLEPGEALRRYAETLEPLDPAPT